MTLLESLTGLVVIDEVQRAPDLFQGAEIDLLLRRGGKRFGVECKRVDLPRLTPSMRIALDDLGLERLAIVHPGPRRIALFDRVEAVPLSHLAHLGSLFPSWPTRRKMDAGHPLYPPTPATGGAA